MLRHFLTEDVFQNGIVRYLRKYSYQNAQNQDLWDTLSNVTTQIQFISVLLICNTVFLAVFNFCYKSGIFLLKIQFYNPNIL